MPADIAAVVNLHQEGSSCVPSLISAWRAAGVANAAGVTTELIVVLDVADEPTREVAMAWTDRGVRIIESNAGDLGAARNIAAKESDATWLAFLDGDDLWSENWLSAAHARATELDSPLTVLHPELNIIFGGHHSVLHHIASTDPAFSWARARLHNPWTALGFTRRQTALDVPYPRNDLANGFGFEDWSWNLEILHRGGLHIPVGDTAHFIWRGERATLLGRSRDALRVPYPNPTDTPVQPPPGATTEISEAQVDPEDLPPTHRHGSFEPNPELALQIRLASTVEPEIAKTTIGLPVELAQNYNTHVTAEQRALEALDLAQGAGRSPAEALEETSIVAELAPPNRDRVVAEFVRSTNAAAEELNESPQAQRAFERYTQLRQLLETRDAS